MGKITNLTRLMKTGRTNTDFVLVIDTEDTSGSAEGTTKRVAVEDLIPTNDGWEYVSDKTYESTPVLVDADVYTQVLNDGTSDSTNLVNLPEGVTRIYDTTANQIKFDELLDRDVIYFRASITLNPKVNNTLPVIRISWTARDSNGVALGTFSQEVSIAELGDGAGVSYERSVTIPVYVGSASTRYGEGIVELKCNTPTYIEDFALLSIING